MKPSLTLSIIPFVVVGCFAMISVSGCKKKDNGVVATSISKMAGTKQFHGKMSTIDPGIHGMGPATNVTFSIQDQAFLITAVDNSTVKIDDINFKYSHSDDVNHYLFFIGNKYTSATKTTTMQYQYESGKIDFTYWDPNMGWGGATIEYWTP